MSLHTTLRRTAATPSISTTTTFICTQCRHATLLRRPKRPYTYTQLITLSDGSTFTHRTSSPLPVYRSTRDTRNSLLWNPSSSKLRNVEDDEAGRLAAFRAKFGRGWDATPAPAPSANVSVTEDGKVSEKEKGVRKASRDAHRSSKKEAAAADATEKSVDVKGPSKTSKKPDASAHEKAETVSELPRTSKSRAAADSEKEKKEKDKSSKSKKSEGDKDVKLSKSRKAKKDA